MNSMEDKLKERIAAKAQAMAMRRQSDSALLPEKLSARGRVEKLVDPDSFQELDLLLTSAESEMDPAAGGITTDGVITGYAEVNGRPLFVWSQDGDVLGGSVGVIHAKKITSVLEKALQMRVPIVGIVDSIGERATDLIEYPHFYSLESILQLQTIASGVIPQIVMVMGSCRGEMAIVPAMADFVFMVRKSSYMHIASAPEGISSEQLGDARMHARTTGTCDVLADSELECLEKCRALLSYLPQHNQEFPPFVDSGDDPQRREEKLLELVPTNESAAFDMQQVISLVVDQGAFFETKRHWAANLITGLTRLGGQTAGIIANNPKNKGGCMTLDAADKMARFVRFCDAFNIPLVWLADCPGFLPSVSEETRGLIRHGSKTIYANSQATVPQITVSIRKLYGGGGLAMPGTGLGGDLLVSWPVLARGVMGVDGAVAILYKGELAAITDEAEREKQRQLRRLDISQRMKLAEQQQPQDFIDPRDTRPFLIKALKMLKNKKRQLPPRKHGNIRL
ncbi:MAG: methylmalonyl-CoA carboxyltransferase [Deltaproteobacteria bacterium]|nr:methylmalonyl-CoA carboxyltransferase [Deltaproteobacteria bacterium]